MDNSGRPQASCSHQGSGELPTSSWALGGTICKLLHYLVNVTAYVVVNTARKCAENYNK